MEQIHSLLRRQLRRYVGDVTSLPQKWREFIESVNSAYFESDSDRRMLERSLELTSNELLNANSGMKAIFERLIYSSTDAIFSFDSEYRYTVWNPAVERIFGLTKLETLGKSAFDIFPHLTKSGEDSLYRQALAGKTIVDKNRLYIVPETGEQIFTEGHFSPLFDNSGKIIGGLAILRDITEQKRAEDALLRSQTYLAEAQRLSQTGSFGWTVWDGKMFWSEETFRIFGYEPECKPTLELMFQRVHPEDAALVQEAMGRASREPHNWDLDHRLQMPDASVKYLHVAAHAVEHQSGQIEYVGSVMDVTQRRTAEDRFHRAFHANPEPISIVTTHEERYIDVNESFLRVTGYDRADVIGRTAFELNFWPQPEERLKLGDALQSQGRVRDWEITFHTKSGERRTGLHSAEVIQLGGQQCVLAILKDITERQVLEQRMRQSQKMEAIGQLSGGIAHDFNNLLNVILGYNELLLDQLDHDGREYAEKIGKAAQRAAGLIKQLLAFTRQQVVQIKVLDLNAITEDMVKMLPRLIGEHILLRTRFDPALGRVKADQGQIEQIIMNLAVNARDAMPDGGNLLIETRNVQVDEEYALRHPPMVPGEYVALVVSDTGTGMDNSMLGRIFEPFFTTKEQGKGTGLGLATVYGAVKQNGGYIWVESELGQGSTFRVYLPLVCEQVQETHTSNASPAIWSKPSEIILVVEDEDSLRTLTQSLLKEAGYTVLSAGNGSKAIEIARNYRGPIHLLLTDVVMPGMNGRAVAESIRQVRPEIRTLYMSGYTGFQDSNSEGFDAPLIAKPFTRDMLLLKLREALADSQFSVA